MDVFKRVFGKHFLVPTIAMFAVVVLAFGFWFITYPVSITTAQMRASLQELTKKVPENPLWSGLKTVQPATITLKDGYILMTSRVDATIAGRTVEADLLATGEPRYRGPSFFQAVCEQLWCSPSERVVTYHFFEFAIVPDSFLINGEPAVELAIPAGQETAVNVANKTAIGRGAKWVAGKLGRTTDDESIRAGTAGMMRRYDHVLIAMFSAYVKHRINDRTLYHFSKNNAEQAFTAVFKGFSVEKDAVTAHFFGGMLMLMLGFAILGAIFTTGWFVSTGAKIARDEVAPKALGGLSDEAADTLGDIIDSAKGD